MADNFPTQRFSGHQDDRRYRGTRLWLDAELTPLRISLAYLVLGLGVLYLSDVVLVRYVSEPLIGQIQTTKGGIEVFLTAAFIFVLTAKREAQHQRDIGRVDQQYEQLQVLHRVLRHNLRNDLNIIQGYTERLREGSETDIRDSEWEHILVTVEQMQRYTEQATRINRISEGDELVQSYDLAALTPRLIADHPYVTDDVEVSISVPDSAVVEANHMFEAALTEVITNAVKHNGAETPSIAIAVSPTEGSERAIEIRISDNGPGIPDHELEPLKEGKEGQVVHLSGLGLWFVMWTIRQSGGELDFEANEQGGTTVRIHVPQASADVGVRSVFETLRSV